MADTWLEPSTVTAVLGPDLSAQFEEEPFAAAVTAVREWVEARRSDLWTPATDTDPAVFTPTGTVKYGAALLAHRWYSRRRSPLGDAEDVVGDILRDDVDLARMLGIGSRFVFGAPSDVEPA